MSVLPKVKFHVKPFLPTSTPTYLVQVTIAFCLDNYKSVLIGILASTPSYIQTAARVTLNIESDYVIPMF